MRGCFLSIGVALLPGLLCTVQGMEMRQIRVAGQTRTYFVHKPAAGSGARALVMVLHGGGSHGEAMARYSGFNAKADREGFVVAYPNGSGRLEKILTWNAGDCCAYASQRKMDDVGFLRAVMDEMIARDGVDRGRVFVTGMSNGAMMAYRAAAEMPERIAAIAPVAGTLTVDPAAIRGGVPVAHFHGTADDHVPWEGGRGAASLVSVDYRPVEETVRVWVNANGAGTRPVVTQMPDKVEDGTTVTRYVYPSARDAQAVVVYKIHGGGHTWPGQERLRGMLGVSTKDISATDLIWEFFAAHGR